jgi:diguanylate cyclase (GGDEF)-like protein
MLRLAACDDGSDAAYIPSTIAIDDIDGGAGFLDAGTPALLDVEVAKGPLLHAMRSVGAQHSAAAPIVARGDVLGLVVASFDRRLPAIEQRLVLERLSGFADQAATAFDNARLLEHSHHQARHDDLTGLPNRPMLEDRANQALARGRRGDALIGLMFVDVDRLKGVNDTLGHQAGDDLIRLVAQRLRGELREVDTLARIGGDEFVVLLEDLADAESATSVAARLTCSFAEPFLVAGHKLEISCSVGLAIERASLIDYETLLRQADAAMYVAKAAGGDSFVVHVPEPARDRRPPEERHALVTPVRR